MYDNLVNLHPQQLNYYNSLANQQAKEAYLATLGYQTALQVVQNSQNGGPQFGAAVPTAAAIKASTTTFGVLKFYNDSPNAVDSELIIGDSIGYIVSDVPSVKNSGVYIRANNVNSGLYGANTGNYFATDTANTPIFIQRLEIYKEKTTTGFINGRNEIKYFTKQRFGEKVTTPSFFDVELKGSVTTTQNPVLGNVYINDLFRGNKNAIVIPIAAGEIIEVRVFITGEAAAHLIQPIG